MSTSHATSDEDNGYSLVFAAPVIDKDRLTGHDLAEDLLHSGGSKECPQTTFLEYKQSEVIEMNTPGKSGRPKKLANQVTLSVECSFDFAAFARTLSSLASG